MNPATWWDPPQPRPYDWMRDYGLRLTFALEEQQQRVALIRERQGIVAPPDLRIVHFGEGGPRG